MHFDDELIFAVLETANFLFLNCLSKKFILPCIFSIRLIAVAVSVHHRHLSADTYDVELHTMAVLFPSLGSRNLVTEASKCIDHILLLSLYHTALDFL